MGNSPEPEGGRHVGSVGRTDQYVETTLKEEKEEESNTKMEVTEYVRCEQGGSGSWGLGWPTSPSRSGKREITL